MPGIPMKQLLGLGTITRVIQAMDRPCDETIPHEQLSSLERQTGTTDECMTKNTQKPFFEDLAIHA